MEAPLLRHQLPNPHAGREAILFLDRAGLKQPLKDGEVGPKYLRGNEFYQSLSIATDCTNFV